MKFRPSRDLAFHARSCNLAAMRIAIATLGILLVLCTMPARSAAPPTNSLAAKLDPVDQEYEKLLADDDAAQETADRWIRENQEFAARGAGVPSSELNQKIMDRFAPVRRAYEDFVKKHPEHARARVAYASFLGDLGEEDGAMAQLDKALTLDPKNPAIYNNLANIHGHSGSVKKAFEYYAKAIELNPREPVYYHNFGTTVYLFRKDAQEFYGITEAQVFEKTFALYSNSMRLDPENFPLATDIAQTYYGIQPLRVEQALKAWTNALKVARDDVERQGVYTHFARIHTLAGHYDEAREQLKRVSDPMYDELKRRLARNIEEREAQSKTNAPASKPS